jgi:hypothetical protein
MSTTGLVDWSDAAVSVGYLLLWAVLGWFAARALFVRRVGEKG